MEHGAFPVLTVGAAAVAAAAAALWALASPGPAAAQEQEPPAPAAAAVPGAAMTAHLLTVGPGDRAEELFGHNALLIRDSASGFEAAYNYGLFDPGRAGFMLDFFRGRMIYRVAPVPLAAMLDGYRAAGRRVWAQELDLEPAEKVRLAELLRTAALPENMNYRYDYFRSNCSTKVRDVLDETLGGQLRAATDQPGEDDAAWRDHTRRLTAHRLHFYLGLQLLMGPRGDGRTTRWQEMWVPMKLRDAAGGLRVERRDGSRRRLVATEELWVDSEREREPAASRSMVLLFLFAGSVLAVLVAALGRRAASGAAPGRIGFALVGVLWGALCLAVAAVIVAMHWTDHEFMHWNQNLLLFSPLGAAVGVGAARAAAKGAAARWARRIAAAALGLAAAGLALHLGPGLAQGNIELCALALPVHAGFAWVLLRGYGLEGALTYADQPG